MFETLFGSEMPLAARFFIAFLVVLGLIGVTAWLVRRFGANRLGGGAARGRQPRLAVIDGASVDGRRRLVLIRRDNVEHLLMIGGPTDVVVEQNIVRAAAARDVARPGMPEPNVRAAAAETAWPLQPINEPPPVAPAAAPRGYRAPATDEPWLPPEPGARPRPADSLTGMASDFSAKANGPEFPPPPVRQEPPQVVPPAPPQPVASQKSDHNLAEMAQQLEAALRRAPAPEHRPPVTDPLAMQAAKAPETARSPLRDFKPRTEPKAEPRVERFEPKIEPAVEPKPETQFEPKAEPRFEPKFEPKVEPKLEPKIEPKPESKVELKVEPKIGPKVEPKIESKPEVRPVPRSAPKPAPKPEMKAEPPKPAASGKTIYDNLEEEMASLLGRPPGKT